MRTAMLAQNVMASGPRAKALRPVTSRQAKQHQKEALWQMPEALF
jgi:hypothetical protein